MTESRTAAEGALGTPDRPADDTLTAADPAGGPRAGGTGRRPRIVLVAVIVLAALATLASGDDYVLFLVQTVVVAAIVSTSLTTLSGTAGQFSLGSAALMGLGAYLSAGIAVQAALPPSVTALVALAAGGAFGLVTGLPALRLRGIYLVMSTLAGHFIVLFALQQYQMAGFGVVGIRVERPGFLESDRAVFVATVLALVVTTLVLDTVQRRRHGRAMRAVRDRDLVAEASGVPVGQVKLFAFVLTSVLIAGAGVLQSYGTGFVAVDQYSLARAVSHVAMIIIGGLGSLPGAIAGAVVVTLLPVLVDELAPVLSSVPLVGPWLVAYEAETVRILYGLLIVVFIVAQPGGLAALARRVGGSLRRRGEGRTP